LALAIFELDAAGSEDFSVGDGETGADERQNARWLSDLLQKFTHSIAIERVAQD
jgi:hypothetical protein